jgi:branched-chain amino acid transport system substrate-binding protein
MGEAAVGILSATHYTPVADDAANQEFVALFQAMKGDDSLPGTYIEAGYIASLVAAEAIADVGGDLSDTQRFLDTLEALEVEGPSGSLRFDARGQAIRDVFVIEVVPSGDGGVTHRIVEVIPAVTQDWSPPQ